jgi:hypothetical protein
MGSTLEDAVASGATTSRIGQNFGYEESSDPRVFLKYSWIMRRVFREAAMMGCVHRRYKE